MACPSESAKARSSLRLACSCGQFGPNSLFDFGAPWPPRACNPPSRWPAPPHFTSAALPPAISASPRLLRPPFPNPTTFLADPEEAPTEQEALPQSSPFGTNRRQSFLAHARSLAGSGGCRPSDVRTKADDRGQGYFELHPLVCLRHLRALAGLAQHLHRSLIPRATHRTHQAHRQAAHEQRSTPGTCYRPCHGRGCRPPAR